MIYVTSDTHFMHNKSFLYKPRGFESIEENNEQIIENWNNIVTDNDIVYHLGDVILSDTERGMECFRRLKGQIKLLRGNHDSDTRWQLYGELPNVELLGYSTMIKYRKFMFYLSHYPTRCSNYDDKGLRNRVINLCGHTHTKDKFADMLFGVIYHCELDAHNNKPVPLDEVIKDLRGYWIKMNETCATLSNTPLNSAESNINLMNNVISPNIDVSALGYTPSFYTSNGKEMDKLISDIQKSIYSQMSY